MSRGPVLGRFYRDVGLVATVAVVARARDLIVIPVLTHCAGAEGYGAWTQAGLIAAFAGPLMGLGLGDGFIRYAAGRPVQEQRRQFSSVVLLCLLMGAGMILAVILFPGPLDAVLFGGNGAYHPIMVIASVNVLIYPLRGLFDAYYIMEGRTRRLAWVRVIHVCLSLSALAITVFLGLDFLWILVGQVGADGVVLLALCGGLFSSAWGRRPSFSWWPRGLRFGLPLIPAGLAMLSVHFIDRLIIPRFCPMSSLGVYAFAYSLAQIALNFSTAPFLTVYTNQACNYYNRGMHAELETFFRQALGSTLMVSLPVAAALVAAGPLLTRLLAPPEFLPAGALIGVIAVGYVGQAVAKVYRVNVAFSRGTAWVLGILLLTCAVNGVLDLLLIPSHGLMGAAWATVAALLLNAFLSYGVANRGYEIHLEPGLLRRLLWASATMAGIMTAMYAITETVSLPDTARLATVGGSGLAMYAAIMAPYLPKLRSMHR